MVSGGREGEGGGSARHLQLLMHIVAAHSAAALVWHWTVSAGGGMGGGGGRGRLISVGRERGGGGQGAVGQVENRGSLAGLGVLWAGAGSRVAAGQGERRWQ